MLWAIVSYIKESYIEARTRGEKDRKTANRTYRVEKGVSVCNETALRDGSDLGK